MIVSSTLCSSSTSSSCSAYDLRWTLSPLPSFRHCEPWDLCQQNAFPRPVIAAEHECLKSKWCLASIIDIEVMNLFRCRRINYLQSPQRAEHQAAMFCRRLMFRRKSYLSVWWTGSQKRHHSGFQDIPIIFQTSDDKMSKLENTGVREDEATKNKTEFQCGDCLLRYRNRWRINGATILQSWFYFMKVLVIQSFHQPSSMGTANTRVLKSPEDALDLQTKLGQAILEAKVH